MAERRVQFNSPLTSFRAFTPSTDSQSDSAGSMDNNDQRFFDSNHNYFDSNDQRKDLGSSKRRCESDKQDRYVPEKTSRSSTLDDAVLETTHSMRTLTIMTERFPEEVFKQVSAVFDTSDRITPTLLALSRYEEILSGISDQQEKLGIEVKEILEKTEEAIDSTHTVASIRASTSAIMAEIDEALRLLQ